MNDLIKLRFDKELIQYKESLSQDQIDQTWAHLERAHILGQSYWKEHLYIHLVMFYLAIKTFNLKEILGQIPRIVLAVPGSVFNKAPIGNIGTTKIGIFEEMIIPKDLEEILKNKNL